MLVQMEHISLYIFICSNHSFSYVFNSHLPWLFQFSTFLYDFSLLSASNIPGRKYLCHCLSDRIYCTGMHPDVGRIVRRQRSPRREVTRIQNKDLIMARRTKKRAFSSLFCTAYALHISTVQKLGSLKWESYSSDYQQMNVYACEIHSSAWALSLFRLLGALTREPAVFVLISP